MHSSIHDILHTNTFSCKCLFYCFTLRVKQDKMDAVNVNERAAFP